MLSIYYIKNIIVINNNRYNDNSSYYYNSNNNNNNNTNTIIANIISSIVNDNNIVYANTLTNNRVLYIDDSGKLASTYVEKEDIVRKQDLLDMIYPVGSIYISVNSTSPATLFGGTWVAFGSGRTLVGINTNDDDFNIVEKTGGEKSHILTIDEMPSHSHNFSLKYWGAAAGNDGHFLDINGNKTQTYTTEQVGNDNGHNNLQPYITVYMWKRTR